MRLLQREAQGAWLATRRLMGFAVVLWFFHLEKGRAGCVAGDWLATHGWRLGGGTVEHNKPHAVVTFVRELAKANARSRSKARLGHVLDARRVLGTAHAHIADQVTTRECGKVRQWPM